MKINLGVVFLLLLSSVAVAGQPNIVLVVADDMGWADAGFNGAEFFETPNIDALATSGMQFTYTYAGQNCAPSRASFLSGMYSPRHQVWTPGGISKGDTEYMRLKTPSAEYPASATMPSETELDPTVVSMAEILTSVGYKTARLGKWHVGDDQQGFDLYSSNGTPGVDQQHYGDSTVGDTLSDAAIDFIDDNYDEHPFFVFLSHWDPHTPLAAEQDVIDKYQAKKDTGGPWTEDWNVTYAAMLEQLDDSVGAIVTKLTAIGELDNTLLIFTSDNGGFEPITVNDPLRGGKGNFYEGGLRVPTVMSWPDVVTGGTTCDTPIMLIDLYPTFAAISGADLPTTQPVDGVSILPLLQGSTIEARSLFAHLPLYLSGSEGNYARNIFGTQTPYWRTTPTSAIWKGDYKLHYFLEDKSVELYDLSSDPGEATNIATSNPTKVNEMLEELLTWHESTNAYVPSDTNDRYVFSERCPE